MDRIAKEVTSPCAKAICYHQILQKLIPDFSYMESETVQNLIIDLVLNMKNSYIVEHLYIDMQMIVQFLPEA